MKALSARAIPRGSYSLYVSNFISGKTLPSYAALQPGRDLIVLSSKEEPAVKQIAFESGANDYMVKLPHRIELLARVRLHSEAYIHELQRPRVFRALEASPR